MELKNVEIIKIGELKTFKGSDFYCVDLVVRTSEEYPQTLLLQCNKEKADKLIKYNKVGMMVDCDINLTGREWTNKEGEVIVFNTLVCWKVFKADGAGATEQVAQNSTANAQTGTDDLPF